MSNINIDDLLEKFPFLTLAVYNKSEYLGIVQNQDAKIISMYVFDEIKDIDMKRMFLEFGNEWWWETNRQIPINIVLGPKFSPYRDCLRTFNLKEFEIIKGPVVCLKDIMQKRVKRKNVQLIRRTD